MREAALVNALGAYSMRDSDMFQVIFNEVSAAEMAALPKALQLELLAQFNFGPEDLEQLDPARFGTLERDGKTLRRLRTRDHRIYFEVTAEGVLVHRVLHRNTLRDFLYRSHLPMVEDGAEGQSVAFWEMIEEGKRSRRE